MERITVKQAAKELCMTELSVRGLMLDGTLQIGYVIGRDKQRKTYVIYREAVEQEKIKFGGMRSGIEENNHS